MTLNSFIVRAASLGVLALAFAVPQCGVAGGPQAPRPHASEAGPVTHGQVTEQPDGPTSEPAANSTAPHELTARIRVSSP